jgi:hypothetical protein
MHDAIADALVTQFMYEDQAKQAPEHAETMLLQKPGRSTSPVQHPQTPGTVPYLLWLWDAIMQC